MSQRTETTVDEAESEDAAETSFDPAQYQTTHGSVPQEIDTGVEDHPVQAELGDAEHREFQYDARITGKRFAERYDDRRAFVREFIANAETACIRRCQEELADAGYDEDELEAMSADELVETAKEETHYTPIIEIYHSSPESDLPAFVIADNGIGISVEEFRVLRNVGLSASHDDGRMLGQYGQGVMSGFLAVGEYGDFTFTTYSYIDEASYRERARIDGFNDCPGTRDTYGTTFRFPSFCDAAREIDIRDAVETYSEGVRVPVLYREYDRQGDEIFNEDYTPTTLEEMAPDDSPTVVYEDDFVEAVASRGISNSRTYLISMPIERNAHSGSPRVNGKRFNWPFHIRLKYEDGRVYQCQCEHDDHRGLVPIDSAAYEKLPDDRRDGFVPRSEIGEEDVLLPTPVDDRDRLESGFGDFFLHVAELLGQRYHARAETVMEILADQGFDQLFEFSDRDQALLFRALRDFGPSKRNITPNRVQEQIEKDLGVEIPDSVASKLSVMREEVSWAPRGTSSPHYKSSRRDAEVRDVIQRAGDEGDVYMGVTLNHRKVELAWALHDDNQVVGLESTSDYDRFADVFGWTKLKELPTRDLADEFPQLDDDVIDRLEKTSGSSSDSSSSGSRTLEPETKHVKVRQGAGNSSEFTTAKAQRVHATFDSGNTISIGWRYDADSLLLLRETNDVTVREFSSYARQGIAYTLVPNYVYDYLSGAENVYESVPELRSEHARAEFDTYDVTPFLADDGVVEPDQDSATSSEAELGELGRETMLVAMPTGARERLDEEIADDVGMLATILRDIDDEFTDIDVTELERLGFVDGSRVSTNWLAFGNSVDEPDGETPHVVTTDDESVSYAVRSSHWSVTIGNVLARHTLPTDQFPRDSPEWELLLDGAEHDIRRFTDEGQALVDTLAQLLELADDPLVSQQDGDEE